MKKYKKMKTQNNLRKKVVDGFNKTRNLPEKFHKHEDQPIK